MGSAVSKFADPCGDLLRAINTHCAKVARAGDDPNYPVIAALIADALHDPKTYQATLIGLAKYLASTVQGGSPHISS